MSSPDWLEAWLTTGRDELVTWRRHLHAHPELSRDEHATTAYVAERLAAAGLTPRVLPGGTGLLCDVGGGPGPLVALRADMDALPLQETTGAEYTSTVPGVSHACGHDAHTALLLGAGLALASAGPLPGRVRLLFQPAEEVMPGGAHDLLAAGALEGASRVFALHCDPRLAVGRVGIKSGAVTSACDVLELEVHSPGGHTSRPHLTADLVHALGTVITGLPALLSRRIDPRTGTVLVWGAVQAGQAANAIPQSGLLRGTLRTGDRETWGLLEPLVAEAVTALLAPTGVTHVLRHVRGVPPVVNERTSTRLLRAAVADGVGESAVAPTLQSSGGEDFAWYLERVPGAMGRLGVWPGTGPQLDLHQPTFDLDERALEVGVRTLVHCALETWALETRALETRALETRPLRPAVRG
ncbi:amidohydrolase [Rhodococcus antarcticus]|uniref:Amidohydrolase n=1 Tax=Rhodococcus antarcticus TaxID=2987751 RepID=A0ABY6P1H7_9NOCA|nr:amidohydrolase [Rhodococcus antarcticus]UZJ25490.1 amidohydrolase [Rhodococcus antarcticus]